MEINELAEKTTKRLGNLTEVELLFSINGIVDYQAESQQLLEAIHSHDINKIGFALITFLGAFNSADILLHEGL